MTDNLFYHPQPSKVLQEYGTIVEDSYFVADGTLHFLESNQSIPCMFEVALMQSGNCWAIAYIQGNKTSKLNLASLPDIGYIADRLEGIERLQNRMIEIHLGSAISSSISSSWDPDEGNRKYTFQVREYSILERSRDRRLQNEAYFFLANLPLHDQYSPQVIRGMQTHQISEAQNLMACESALSEVIKKARTGSVSDDELLELGRRRFQEENKKFPLEQGMRILMQNPKIKLEVNGNIIATITSIRPKSDQQYEAQPLALLTIYLDLLPKKDGWSAIGLAQWIVSLLSFSLGRMIIWNYSSERATRRSLKRRRTWSTTTLNPIKFLAITEHHGYLSVHGLDEGSNALTFVSQALSIVAQRPFNETLDYLNALNDFVHYSSTSSNDQQRCILLCALAESLYMIWERQPDIKVEQAIDKQSSRKIQQAAKKAIKDILKEVVSKEPNEVAADYEKRHKGYIDRVGEGISNSLKASYADKLSTLFTQHGWRVDKELRKELYTKSGMIHAFVRSRNKLFHEHCFVTNDKDKQERIDEIKNIELFVRLLFLTLLGYEGMYWDPMIYGGRFASMPRKSDLE